MIPPEFHFLRPLWLLGFLPLAFIVWQLLAARRTGGNWRSVCDAALLPFVLMPEKRTALLVPALLTVLTGSLGLTALAGPTWQRLPQPVYSRQSALVIVADLSRSMDAEDLSPNRLARMRFKVADLLAERREGETALIVFAGDAYTVTPLTDDTATIAALVPTLETGLMPTQGSRADRGVAKALELLEQAGSPEGAILLITDGVSARHADAILTMARESGVPVSVLAVGTEAGAPIPTADGFLKDRSGEVVVPRLKLNPLVELARESGGRFARLQIDDGDLDRLRPAWSELSAASDVSRSDVQSDIWLEFGPWLLLPAVLLASLAFRRGVVVCLLLFAAMPFPGTAVAGVWEDTWLRPDQQAARALEADDAEQAAELFEDARWRAAAQFRAGRYADSAETLAGLDDAESHYNRGNALARSGNIDEALDAYNTALNSAPDHEDARFNRDLLEQMKEQQANPRPGDSAEQQAENDPQAGSQSEQQNPQSDSNETQSQDSQSAENRQDGADQQNGEPQQSAAADDPTEFGEQTQEEQLQADSTEESGRPEQEVEPREPEGEPQDMETQLGAEREQNEADRAAEQWLRRIPDDPGGLLRNKFRYRHRQRGAREQDEDEAW